MVEFTGERVVPGQVNADLWSEHFARYAYARRFATAKIVLDAGCGTGYGTAELAQSARLVIGFDLAPDAVVHARTNYPLANLAFAAASAELLPFPSAHFDLIVAFEVIEHLPRHRDFLREAARVLCPRGLFLVSTPNKTYYAESRAASGPNPFHQREFEAEEFHQELSAVFPHVTLLAQNRVESFAFHPFKTFWPSEARIDGGAGSPADAHFFLALCSHSPLPEQYSFSYVPRAANVLREREQHVKLLERQLDQTKLWHRQTTQERDDLLALHRKQQQELEERNHWAAQLSAQLEASNARVVELQEELAREQAAAVQVAAGYEAQIRQLEEENAAKTHWARETEQRLTQELRERDAQVTEYAHLLAQAEATVEERTQWAQRTEAERQTLAAQVNGVRASRWVKLGRSLGLGPGI